MQLKYFDTISNNISDKHYKIIFKRIILLNIKSKFLVERFLFNKIVK